MLNRILIYTLFCSCRVSKGQGGVRPEGEDRRSSCRHARQHEQQRHQGKRRKRRRRQRQGRLRRLRAQHPLPRSPSRFDRPVFHRKNFQPRPLRPGGQADDLWHLQRGRPAGQLVGLQQDERKHERRQLNTNQILTRKTAENSKFNLKNERRLLLL